MISRPVLALLAALEVLDRFNQNARGVDVSLESHNSSTERNLARAQNHRPLNYVLQFANVWPGQS